MTAMPILTLHIESNLQFLQENSQGPIMSTKYPQQHWSLTPCWWLYLLTMGLPVQAEISSSGGTPPNFHLLDCAVSFVSGFGALSLSQLRVCVCVWVHACVHACMFVLCCGVCVCVCMQVCLCEHVCMYLSCQCILVCMATTPVCM